MLSAALNPFQKISGAKALISGILIICMMSYFGVIAKFYFPGILSCLNSYSMENLSIKPNFYLLLYQNLISWIVSMHGEPQSLLKNLV